MDEGEGEGGGYGEGKGITWSRRNWTIASPARKAAMCSAVRDWLSSALTNALFFICGAAVKSGNEKRR